MTLKHLFFAVSCLTVSGVATAQDKIFKSNGDVIEAKIKNIGTRQIIYRRTDNPTGPEYFIPKDEVDKVRYENGTEETIAGNNASVSSEHRHDRNSAMKGKYKSNILAFAPIQFTEAGIAGFSVSYEKALDKNNIVAFYVPAIMEFNMNTQYDYYGQRQTTNDGMFYLMPGIKLYPTGGYGVAKYAIGPSLVVATGTKTDYDNYYYGNYATQHTHTMFGMMVNQSININPTPHLYLGTELGIGFTYVNNLSGISQGTTGLVQFSFKVGYRF